MESTSQDTMSWWLLVFPPAFIGIMHLIKTQILTSCRETVLLLMGENLDVTSIDKHICTWSKASFVFVLMHVCITGVDFANMWIYIWCQLEWELTWKDNLRILIKLGNLDFTSIQEVCRGLAFLVSCWRNEMQLINIYWINT